MILAPTPSMAPSPFSPSADGTADAGSTPSLPTSTSKKDSEETPDFSALFAMLLPSNLLMPTVSTASAPEKTGVVSPVAVPETASPALAVATNSDLALGNPNAPATIEPQALSQAPLNEAPAADTSAATLPGAEPGAAKETSLPPTVAPFTALSDRLPSNANSIPSTLKNAAQNQTTMVPSRALLDAKAAATEDAAHAASEKLVSSDHGPKLETPELDPVRIPNAPSPVQVAMANEPQEFASNAEDDARSAAKVSARMHPEGETTLVARAMEPTVKPAIPFVDQVHSAFQNHLDPLREHGRVELRMELHPPELGKMRLHLSMDDNQLQIRMDVQDERARQVIEQQLQPLRVHFAEMGVNLGQLDVRRDGTGNAPQQDQNSDAYAHSGAQADARPDALKLRNAYARDVHPDSLVDVLV